MTPRAVPFLSPALHVVIVSHYSQIQLLLGYIISSRSEFLPSAASDGKKRKALLLKVKALEKELIKRAEEQGVDVNPQIVVVTR